MRYESEKKNSLIKGRNRSAGIKIIDQIERQLVRADSREESRYGGEADQANYQEQLAINKEYVNEQNNKKNGRADIKSERKSEK